MTREIKFRAWDKKEKFMYFFHDPHFEYEYRQMVLYWSNKRNEFELEFCGKENIEIMQYTGLKDKNSKEIYEGDIIFDEDGEYSKTVVISQAEEPDPIGFFAKDIYTDESYALCEVDGEIIGNIYENPELLSSIKERS